MSDHPLYKLIEWKPGELVRGLVLVLEPLSGFRSTRAVQTVKAEAKRPKPGRLEGVSHLIASLRVFPGADQRERAIGVSKIRSQSRGWARLGNGLAGVRQ